MSRRSTHHATFAIARDYAAPLAREHGTRELLNNLEKVLRHG